MVKKRHQFALVGSNSGLKNVSLTHLIGRTVDYMHKENKTTFLYPRPPPQEMENKKVTLRAHLLIKPEKIILFANPPIKKYTKC